MNNQIGRYELQIELGRGGFGRVFRAWDPTVGRLVAIKTMHAPDDRELLTRFRNEAIAAGKLKHRNIVTIYDFGVYEGSPYLVMELLEGDDLDRVSSTGTLTLAQRLTVLIQAADGLHHAHTHGVLHRDVKPANIMLLRDGSVKLLDFGIALVTQESASRITPQGSILGTLSYMSPEQLGGAPSDSLTDIFAFGGTCYKLLTGVHPFHAAEIHTLMFNILNQSPAPLRANNPECPEALEPVVLRMLSKDRGARYQTLEDVKFDLDQVLLDLQRDTIEDLLTEARRLQQDEQLDAALSIVKKILELERGNRPARILREQIQRQINDTVIRPQVETRMQTGRQHMESRNFAKAIEAFDSALRLDPSNRDLQVLVTQAKASKDRSDQANRLFEAARQFFQRGELKESSARLSEALAVDPNHSQAKALLDEVNELVEARNRERHRRELSIREAIAKGESAIKTRLFDNALILLDEAIREYGPEEELRLARESALRAKALNDVAVARALEEERLNGVLRSVDALLARGMPEEAWSLLNKSPDDPRFTTLRSRCQRDRLVKQARTLANEESQLDRALTMLGDALRLHGPDAELVALREELYARKAERDWRSERSRVVAEFRAIEAIAATESNPKKLGALGDDARRTTARFRQDPEISAAVRRLEQRIDNLLIGQSPRSKPWTRIGLIAAAIAVLGASVLFIVRPDSLVTMPVRTDPEGASVTMNGKSCVTPNCSFRLKPGSYELRARLDGFKTSVTTVAIDPKSASEVNLRLEPLLPPASTSPSNPGLGTLVVSASLADAVVFVDKTRVGSTDSLGNFRWPLQSATYQVHVEKTGYQSPPDRRVTIGTGVVERVAFTLIPRAATVVVRGAPAGVDLWVGATLLGRTDGSALFSASIQPGDQALLVIQGSAKRQIPIRTKPDETMTFDWREIAPPSLRTQASTANPVQPIDFVDLDDRAWAHTNSRDVQALQSYLERFQQGRHKDEAVASIRRIEAEADKQAVLDSLSKLSQAIAQKNETLLKAIWPSIPASRLERWKSDFHNARSLQYELHPSNLPDIKGDTAMIKCDLLERKVFDSGEPYVSNSAVYLGLHRVGGGWVVQSVR